MVCSRCRKDKASGITIIHVYDPDYPENENQKLFVCTTCLSQNDPKIEAYLDSLIVNAIRGKN